ncbi:DUF6241 domain-containing protein [Priestia flexa]|uniref:Uncharacterized protein n=1 Tax=Priestia flexa TaxID=86664 RepID=A0A8I1MGF2_9BACI|nr:DUF6241 domain-containing protein [Priestia flexa]MBN8251896.1 hypothetical protein [Priestia flexa]MBN8435396.1 hypothetical protein [Priestia flexa]MCA0968027.1 DUF6241 domain-containing protein [Priestia flexa]RIV04920.1 hypothetical protein D1859_17220 [Priestia flexa]UIR28640.1 DUF6241 domain-containing protein [Priestia flexa]
MVHYGSASINDKKAGYSSLTTAASVEKEKAEEIEEEIKEQTSFIGGVSEELGITADSEESEVMQIMHEMTHQKVRAQDKWGAVPLTNENVKKVIAIVEASSFEHKTDMLTILKRWENDNFSTVAEDHNFFWRLQGGNVGQAYGTLTIEEEQKFIENNFAE